MLLARWSLPFIALPLVAAAERQSTGLDAVISQLPNCAVICLFTAITKSPCDLTDQTCQCTNLELQRKVQDCVLSSCTVKQSLVTMNITRTACNVPVRDKSRSIKLCNIVLSVTTATIGLLRLFYKYFRTPDDFGWDDFFVLTIMVVGATPVALIDRGVIPNGLGRDVWTLTPEQITRFARWLYALEILYFAQMPIVKAILLCFFLRIFPKPTVRRLLWGTLILNAVWGFVFTITSAFQCTPISHYWTSWDKETRGQCRNINALVWTHAATNIILDIWILALPLYQVLQLQMSWPKKLGVATMFFVGTFVTVVSILRLRSIVHFGLSKNPTWDQADVIQWSNIEICVGVICGCMPTLRVIFVQMFPKILGSQSATASHRYYTKYGHHVRPNRARFMESGSDIKSGILNSVFEKERDGDLDDLAIRYTKTIEVQHTSCTEKQLHELQIEGRSFGSTAVGYQGVREIERCHIV